MAHLLYQQASLEKRSPVCGAGQPRLCPRATTPAAPGSAPAQPPPAISQARDGPRRQARGQRSVRSTVQEGGKAALAMADGTTLQGRTGARPWGLLCQCSSPPLCTANVCRAQVQAHPTQQPFKAASFCFSHFIATHDTSDYSFFQVQDPKPIKIFLLSLHS